MSSVSLLETFAEVGRHMSRVDDESPYTAFYGF